MTGLTPDDISRLIAGLILTRKERHDPERKIPEDQQEARIITELLNESSTQMLLDVARADIRRLRQLLTAADLTR